MKAILWPEEWLLASQVFCTVDIVSVTERTKAWTVFVLSNTGIVGSNPTQVMNVCLYLFCVCVR
jgi:hypothetical protein